MRTPRRSDSFAIPRMFHAGPWKAPMCLSQGQTTVGLTGFEPMLTTLAEYEREYIVERVNAGIAVARQNGIRFGRPVSDPVVIADKLANRYRCPGRRTHCRRRRSSSSAGAAQRSAVIS
jgi:hypothetical protein